MIKIPAAVLFSLLLYSCSGYFGQVDMKDGVGISPLAISGGGYLSSSTANEITPFLFHDATNGRDWLFFSSDRNGNYDIYYAELYANGTFGQPVLMDTNINTTNDEYSPIVYYGYIFNTFTGNFLHISFIRVTGGQTNIMNDQLFMDYRVSNVAMVTNNAPVSRLSIFYQTNTNANYLPVLMCSLGNSNWTQITWNSSSPFTFNVATAFTNRINANPYPVYSVQGYFFTNTGTSNYIMDNVISGRHQLFFSSYSGGNATNFKKISAYDSIYNDRDPFVDLQTMKVYFSSDRKGTYDLYRYNILTFDKVIQ